MRRFCLAAMMAGACFSSASAQSPNQTIPFADSSSSSGHSISPVSPGGTTPPASTAAALSAAPGAGGAFAAKPGQTAWPVTSQIGAYFVTIDRPGRPIAAPAASPSQDTAEAIGVANAKVVQLFGEGRHADALELARQTSERAERELGGDNPATLSSVNNLALLLKAQGRYGEAEPLYKRILGVFERVLGEDHPNTLTSVNNLAALYDAEGSPEQAERLYKRALETSDRVRGREHPDTLGIKGNLTALLTREGKTEEAFREFQSLENGLAFWLDAETDSPERGVLRRRVLEANAGYQDAMLSFALKYPSEASARFAADVILRWKKRPLQDEAYLARLMHNSDDPNIVAAARTVRERSVALAAAAGEPKPALQAVESLKQSLEAAEADLRQRSQNYRRYVQVNRATAQAVQSALPEGGAYIEYRFFNAFDFEKNAYGKLHLLAVVLRPDAAPALVDLGEAGPIFAAQQALINARSTDENGASLPELRRFAYGKLIAPLKDRLAGAKTVIISPDGPLNALPFESLLGEKVEALLNL